MRQAILGAIGHKQPCLCLPRCFCTLTSGGGACGALASWQNGPCSFMGQNIAMAPSQSSRSPPPRAYAYVAAQGSSSSSSS